MNMKIKTAFHSIRHGDLEAFLYRHRGPTSYCFTIEFGKHFQADWGPAVGRSFGEADVLAIANLAIEVCEWLAAQPREYTGDSPIPNSTAPVT